MNNHHLIWQERSRQVHRLGRCAASPPAIVDAAVSCAPSLRGRSTVSVPFAGAVCGISRSTVAQPSEHAQVSTGVAGQHGSGLCGHRGRYGRERDDQRQRQQAAAQNSVWPIFTARDLLGGRSRGRARIGRSTAYAAARDGSLPTVV